MTTPPNPSRPKPRRRPSPLDGRGHGRGTAADPASNTRTPKISIAQLASKTPVHDSRLTKPGSKVQSSKPSTIANLNPSPENGEARRLAADLLRAEQTVKGWGKGGWRIIHVLSGMPVTTHDSFVYGNGAKYGYFRTKRAANKAIDALLKSEIDWSQGVEYYAGKRPIVQTIFDRLFEAGL